MQPTKQAVEFLQGFRIEFPKSRLSAAIRSLESNIA